jgi:alpha-L-rhamnosidase
MRPCRDTWDSSRGIAAPATSARTQTWTSGGGFGDWLALDGSGQLEGATPKDLIGTAFYAQDADLMARIAGVLGCGEDSAHYASLHAEILKAFRGRFFDEATGLLRCATQTAYVLALRFGLVPEGQRSAFAGELVRLIAENGFHIGTGFVGTPHILHVLSDNGQLETAYRLLEQEEFPSWLFPVKNGATTIWERWNGWTPHDGFADESMNSFNHYAYGAVGEWMYTTVAGLNPDPEEPGYRHIIFRPRPGGTLTRASAALETAYGRAAICWERSGHSLHIDLEVPPGTHATLHPPDGSDPVPLHPGSHAMEFKLAAAGEPEHGGDSGTLLITLP